MLGTTQMQGHQARPIDASVVFLSHYIPLYQVRVLQSIAAQVRDFRVLLSTPIEPNRDFAPDWSGLDVTVQDTWTMRHRWRHRGDQESVGFDDQLYVHFPYDTNRRLREMRPDVVMSLELGARSFGVIRYCRKHPETRSILCTYMSEHTEQHRGWLRRQLRKRLIQGADALTFNGPSCKRYLKSYGVEDDQLFHFPYAADDRTVYMGPVHREESETRFRLLCVGQLSERKGVSKLVQQITGYCRLHPQRQITLSFAGRGPLESQLAALKLPSNLKLQFLGTLTPDDLAVEMLRSGVLVAPTLADEWLLVVNEALQAGLPVLGSVYAQAATTLIRDGYNGWRYDPADKSSFYTALNAYFDTSDSDLAAMRVDARASVAQRTPEWAAMGAVSAIRSVMGMKQGRPKPNNQADSTAEANINVARQEI